MEKYKLVFLLLTTWSVFGLSRHAMADTAAAVACDAQIGVTVPEFNCRDVSQTNLVNGIPGKASLLNGQTIVNNKCDKPGMLGGSCQPGSMGAVLYNSPDVQIYLSCRWSGTDFGDVAIIQTNRNTGATCFHQGGGLDADEGRRPILPDDHFYQNGGAFCTGCHDNGGFLRSPYMAATQNINHRIMGTAQKYYYNNNTPFWNVTNPELETYAIRPTNTTCAGCHRLSALKVSSTEFDTRGTASHYALASTADNYDNTNNGAVTIGSDVFYPRKQYKIQNKSVHSASSPLWMPVDYGNLETHFPGFDAPSFAAAAQYAFCTTHSFDSPLPSNCLSPLKHPRSSDIEYNQPAQGQFGGATVSNILSKQNPVTLGNYYPIYTGYFNTENNAVGGAAEAKVDLAWAEPTEPANVMAFKWVFQYQNATLGSFSSPASYQWNLSVSSAVKPYKPLVGDFNGDGLTDLAVAQNDKITIRYNLGGNTFGNQTEFPFLGAATVNIATGDFDGDRKTDLYVWTFNNPGATVARNMGAGNFGNYFNVSAHSASTQEVFAGDINGDGYADILSSAAGSLFTKINLYDRTQQPISASKLGQFSSSPNGVATTVNLAGMFVGDINADKLADIGQVTDLKTTSTVNGVVMNNKAVQIRYSVKGTEARYLKNKTGECLTAIEPIATAQDIPFVKKDKPLLETKPCSNGTSFDAMTTRQIFYLGYHTWTRAKIESLYYNRFQLFAESSTIVKQADINNLSTALNKTDWDIVYGNGGQTYFQIKSVGYAGQCLRRNPSTSSVVLAACAAGDDNQLWTHLLNP